ncbi:MAG: hypothetical protein WCD13_03605, partial [Pseudolabrys sp.]
YRRISRIAICIKLPSCTLNQMVSRFRTLAGYGIGERGGSYYSLIYGLAVMSMALFTGWVASIAFRRD